MKKIHTTNIKHTLSNILYRLGTAKQYWYSSRYILSIDFDKTNPVTDPLLGFNITGLPDSSAKISENSIYFLSKEDAEDFAKLHNIDTKYSPIRYNNAANYTYYDAVEFKPGKYLYLNIKNIRRFSSLYPNLGIDADSLLNTDATNVIDSDVISTRKLMNDAYVTFITTLEDKLFQKGFSVNIKGDYLTYNNCSILASFSYSNPQNNLKADIKL